MTPLSRLLMALGVLAGISLAPCAFAQASKPLASAPPTAIPGATAEPDVFPGLPRPPDAPRSLLEAPAPTPPYSCAPLPGPYFEPDPRLDLPPLPQPGWFTNAEVAIVGPHIKNRLTDVVQIGGLPPATVHLPSAELDWTASPRIEVGYRLLSGFGEFVLGYRILTTDGTGSVPGLDTLADLKSRLDINIADLDYASREISLWPHCGMKWWFGLRFANVYFDSRAVEPFAAAAAGSGIFEQKTTNHYWGLGPNYGVELRQGVGSGLGLVIRADGTSYLGRTRQSFFERTTSVGPEGQQLVGETRRSNPQTVPVLNLFAGLQWQPPAYPNLRLFLGYEYEYWWDVARLSTTTSRGELSDQGVLLRAEVDW